MDDHEYIDDRNYITYGEGAVFIRRCPDCSRFVKADESVMIREWDGKTPDTTATCKVHGRVAMPFLGHY